VLILQVGNPVIPSSTPDPFTTFSSPMTFLQRTYNLLMSIVGSTALHTTYFVNDRLMRSYFGDDLPYIGEILRNTSLLLVNHHPSLSIARPQTPNTVDVAGMHIYPPKPLPKVNGNPNCRLLVCNKTDGQNFRVFSTWCVVHSTTKKNFKWQRTGAYRY